MSEFSKLPVDEQLGWISHIITSELGGELIPGTKASPGRIRTRFYEKYAEYEAKLNEKYERLDEKIKSVMDSNRYDDSKIENNFRHSVDLLRAEMMSLRQSFSDSKLIQTVEANDKWITEMKTTFKIILWVNGIFIPPVCVYFVVLILNKIFGR